MPDENTEQQQNTEDSSSTDNQQNNNNGGTNFGGSGKKIVVGIDHGGMDDSGYLATVVKGLEECGNEVISTGVDPNQEGLMQGHGADLAVFLTNGIGAATYWSFSRAIKSGSLPFTVFMTEGWYHVNDDPSSPIASLENARAESYDPEHDAGQFMDAASVAQMKEDGQGATTVGEFFDKNSQYMTLCWAASPEEAASQICSGSCGGGSGSGTAVNSGGGAQIKDKTFEKCIRRICAATDSIFIVENNAAVLFPYTDWMAFTLRQKINTIKSNEIDPNIFHMEYGNDGFYNKVSIAWGGATLPERFPSKEDSKEQTKKDKISSNYTVSDILKNMISTNFTYKKTQQEPSTTVNKKDKTTQTISVDDTGATILSEQYDSLVDIYGEMEKRVESAAPDLETAQYIVNALLIQYIRDYNATCRCRALNVRKYIGGTFYAVENPTDKKSELFYLNGYSIRTQKDDTMYHDLDFKYGPEGAEEILDYQTLSGGAASGGATTNTSGGSANEEEVWKNGAKITYAHANSTQDPEEAWKMFGGKEDQSSTDCYGMSAYLYYCFNNQAGIPCRVVGNSGHHVVMLNRNGQWEETRDEYRKYNFDRLFKWRDNQDTSLLLDAPGSVGSTSGGNTNKQNTNSGNNGGS